MSMDLARPRRRRCRRKPNLRPTVTDMNTALELLGIVTYTDFQGTNPHDRAAIARRCTHILSQLKRAEQPSL